MTNGIAIALVVLVLGFLALDATVLHWQVPLAAGRAFVRLVEWLSFWR